MDDLRGVLRLAAGRDAEASAAIINSRTLRDTPESGEDAGMTAPDDGPDDHFTRPLNCKSERRMVQSDKNWMPDKDSNLD